MKDFLFEMFGHLNTGDRCRLSKRGKLSPGFVARYGNGIHEVIGVERRPETVGMGFEKFQIRLEDGSELFLPRLCLDRVKGGAR